uniref:Secreted protein n=1 Tax=Parascaris univalens TaxID=6257 RepID=A0A915APP5_PARUN
MVFNLWECEHFSLVMQLWPLTASHKILSAVLPHKSFRHQRSANMMMESSNTMKVALNSVESTIGMNPINPVLLEHAPPPPTTQQQQQQHQVQRPLGGILLSKQSNSSTSSNRRSARKRHGSKRS